ncbi:MAG: hypothetical protein GF421_10690, partial [Candidatus Aminicenantes bacterium]|nr:hypothetical protein [Candidatus Aminicenantes bacterium]
MNKNKIRLTAMVVLFGAVLVVSGILLTWNQTPVKTSSQSSEINFQETGHLINWDSASGTHTDTWQLVVDREKD